MRIIDHRLRQLLERISEIHNGQRIRIGREGVNVPSLVRRREIVEVSVEIGRFRDVLEIRFLLHELDMQSKSLLKRLGELLNGVADECSVQEESSDTPSRRRSNTQTMCVSPCFDRFRDEPIWRYAYERLHRFEGGEWSAAGLMKCC